MNIDALCYLISQYHPLTRNEHLLIANAFQHYYFKDRDVLMPADKICNKLFFVLKGVLRIASVNEKGIEISHWFFNENKLCTVIESFKNQQPSNAFIQACCNAEVLMINRDDLFIFYTSIPFLEDVINLILHNEMIEKINARNLYVGASALDIYKLFLEHQPDVAMRISQKDIASFLGITQQSLSRLRKNLQSQ